MKLMLPDVQDVVRKALSYEAFSYYPVTYYLTPEGTFTDVPGQDTVKIDCYVYFVKPDAGLILYYTHEENIPISAFKYVSGIVMEQDESVPQLLSELIDSVMRGELRPNLTRHEKMFLSLLLDIKPEELDAIAREAYLTQELADRTVAVFSDFVVVLSKKHVLKVYEGEDAVRVAKRVSFIVESPIYSIASHIRRMVRPPATIFYNSDGFSVLCNSRDCVVIPLPANIARSVASMLSKEDKYLIYEPNRDVKMRVYIPSDAVILSRRGFFLVEKIDDNMYQAKRRLRVSFALPAPILITRDGSQAYCKFRLQENKLTFEVVRGEPKRETEEDFAEEIILGI